MSTKGEKETLDQVEKETIFCLACGKSFTEYEEVAKGIRILPEHKAKEEDKELCAYGHGNSWGSTQEEYAKAKLG